MGAVFDDFIKNAIQNNRKDRWVDNFYTIYCSKSTIMEKKKRTKRDSVTNLTQRKIYFYRVFCGNTDDKKPISFDPLSVFNRINDMTNEDKYLDVANEALVYAWPPSVVNSHCRMCLANIRRNGLPSIEQQGMTSDLSIPPDAGLAEKTHLVFFPHNIVGAEHNPHGPRVNRVARYVNTKIRLASGDIAFEQLVRDNITESLLRLETIKALELTLDASNIDVVRNVDTSIAEMCDSLMDNTKDRTISITISLGRSKGATGRRLKDWVKRMIGIPGIRGVAKHLEVRGVNQETEKVDTVNLLRDSFVVCKTVQLENERTRTVNPDSIYREIEAAYREQENELKQTLGVLI